MLRAALFTLCFSISATLSAAVPLTTLIGGGPVTSGPLTLSNFSFANTQDRATDLAIDPASIDVTITNVVSTGPVPFFFEYDGYVELVFNLNGLTLIPPETRWRTEVEFDIVSATKAVGLLRLETDNVFANEAQGGDWEVFATENGSLQPSNGSIRNINGSRRSSGGNSVDNLSSLTAGWRGTSSLFTNGGTPSPLSQTQLGGFVYQIYYADPPPPPPPPPVAPVPLPAGLTLLGSGAFCLLVWRRGRSGASHKR